MEDNKEPSGGFPARCCLCLPTGTKPTRPYRSCRTREPLQRGIQAITTMAALQGSWDFLNDFNERGTTSIDDFLVKAPQSKWGAVSNGSILGAQHLQEMEDKYLPG